MMFLKFRSAWLAVIAISLNIATLSTLVAEDDVKPVAEKPADEKPTDEKPTDGDAKAVKTVEVKLKGLVLNVPESWKQSQPTSRLRLGQFAIPKVKGDEEDGELAIFNFGGGGDVKANVDRWVGQFTAEGRESKVTKGPIENGQYVLVEITGTYLKPVGPPIQRKTVAASGSRMLGVILGREDIGLFFMKMTGPDKTVKAQAEALRKSFGADVKKEEPLEFK